MEILRSALRLFVAILEAKFASLRLKILSIFTPISSYFIPSPLFLAIYLFDPLYWMSLSFSHSYPPPPHFKRNFN